MCHFIHKFPCKTCRLEAGRRGVKALSGETEGDPLSKRRLQCPVILLLYMCKSLASCQRPHLGNGVTGQRDPSADKEEFYLSAARS